MAKGKYLKDETGKKLKGLTKLLQRNFYPSYTYESATEQTYFPKPVPKHAPGAFKRWRKQRGGALLGTKLGRDVAKSLKLLQKYSMPIECFFNLESTAGFYAAWITKMKTKTDKATFKSVVKSLYLSLFWMQMKRRKIMPIATEVPVRHATKGMGTMIDVVCLDQANRYVLLELKTGCKYQYKHTKVKMNYPFADKDDSVHNQHQLQVAASVEMYKHTYPTHVLAEPLILRLHTNQTEFIALELWASQRVPEMFNYIRNGDKDV